jgi:lipoate-protein ligase A
LDVERVVDAFVRTFAAQHDVEPIARNARTLDGPALRSIHHRYVSWEWCYGRTPPFEVSLSTKFSWGEVNLRFAVEEGRIVDAAVQSESFDGAEVGHLEGEFLDCPFKPSSMARHVRNVIGRDGHGLLEDVADWLAVQPLN